MKITLTVTVFALTLVPPAFTKPANERSLLRAPATGNNQSQTSGSAASGQSATQTSAAQSKDEQEIARLEKEWDDAVINADKAALARIAADDYFNYSDVGGSRGNNKEKFISGFGTNPRPADVTERHEIDEVVTRILGDVAIVNARVTPVITVKGQEQPRDFRGQFTHVWVKRGGRWQLVGDQYNPTSPVLKPPVATKVDAAVLDAYVGKYGNLTVTKEGEKLVVTAGQNKFPLTPMSDTSFFLTNVPVRITFVRDAKGQVTHMYINENGRANEVEKSK